MDFKIGDRVRVTGYFEDDGCRDADFTGEYSTIKYIDDRGNLNIGVEFEIYNNRRHTLAMAPEECRVPSGYGYWFNPEQLVKEEPLEYQD